MVYTMYSIFDVKTGSYSVPQCYVNEDVAKRTVQAAAVDGSLLKSFPSDFILYSVGTFDDKDGVFVDDDKKNRFVCSVADLIVKE